jgi:DNA invertase Pin-like site-specific DNA recombinase
MTIYGYARVSTDGQSLDAQRDQLASAGASKVFSEKESGAKSDRKELAKLLKRLQANDVLIITKLDRLARSTKDMLIILDDISKKGASFKSLHEQWADTTTGHGKLIITVLAGVAEFERQRILERTNKGRIRAKANGIKFGRKPKLTHHQKLEAIERIKNGDTLVEIARSYNVDPTTIGRLQ